MSTPDPKQAEKWIRRWLKTDIMPYVDKETDCVNCDIGDLAKKFAEYGNEMAEHIFEQTRERAAQMILCDMHSPPNVNDSCSICVRVRAIRAMQFKDIAGSESAK